MNIKNYVAFTFCFSLIAGQSSFSGVAGFLGSNKIVKKMSLAAEQQLEMLKIIKEE